MSTIKSKEDGVYSVAVDDLIPLVDNAGTQGKSVTPQQLMDSIPSIDGIVQHRSGTIEQLMSVTDAVENEIAICTDYPCNVHYLSGGTTAKIVPWYTAPWEGWYKVIPYAVQVPPATALPMEWSPQPGYKPYADTDIANDYQIYLPPYMQDRGSAGGFPGGMYFSTILNIELFVHEQIALPPGTVFSFDFYLLFGNLATISMESTPKTYTLTVDANGVLQGTIRPSIASTSAISTNDLMYIQVRCSHDGPGDWYLSESRMHIWVDTMLDHTLP